MTDITELAQREKFEAWAHSQKLSLAYGYCGYAFSSTEMAWRAWMASSAELVEALEKAQQTEKTLENRNRRLDGIITAAEKRIAELECQLKSAENNEIDARCHIAELESRTVTDWIEHDGKWRPESLGLDELVYLKTRKQELKIPYPAGKVKGWMSTGGDMDVMAYKLASPQVTTVSAAAAGIKVEAE